jgi:hypothetical protein
MSGLRAFLREESGAVTIDWVALTGGILLLGLAIVYVVHEEGVDHQVGVINETLNNQGGFIDPGPKPFGVGGNN